MNAVDTNVLLYVHDPRDSVKQSKAEFLVQSLADGVLLWQVACEYVAASRKLSAFGFGPQDAWKDLRSFHQRTAVVPQWQHHTVCEDLMRRYSLSFWDALLIATAKEVGVTTLYSEDCPGVHGLPGINIINPFALP